MSTATVERGEVLGALAQAFARRSTGILNVRHGKLKRLFCLERGALVFAASNMIEEQLGAYLVAKKLLTPGACSVATREAAEAGCKLSAHLARNGGELDADGLRAGVEGYITWLLLSSVARPEAEVEFAAGQPNLEGEHTVRLSCLLPLLEHTRRHPASSDQVRVRVGPPNCLPTRIDPAWRQIGDPPPTAAVGYLVENCDGTHDLGTLLSQSPVAADETLRALYALLLLGAVEARVPETKKEAEDPERMTREECLARIARADECDHYMLLGLSPDAGADEIREAYYYLARRYHPDRFRSGPLRDLASRMEAYFTKVTEASNTLSDPDLRRAYDEDLRTRGSAAAKQKESELDPTYLARQNFARGKLLLGKKQYHDALRFLQNAVQQDGSKAPYHLELGRALSRNPRERTQAEKHLRTAKRLDPSLVDTYLVLGELYAKMDRREDAVASYQEALRWEPTNAEARAELTGLGVDPDGKQRLFGRLFKG